MKKILCFIAIFVYANASNSFKSIETYFNLGGSNTQKIQKLIKNDEYLLQGVKYLEDKNHMAVINLPNIDAESKDKTLTPTKVPAYDKALESFKLSVNKYKNPISAYNALHIIDSYFGRPNYLRDYHYYAKVFYENEKGICQAYINMAEVYVKGIATKVDKSKAHKIYKEALTVPTCQKSWYKQVLTSKLIQTR